METELPPTFLLDFENEQVREVSSEAELDGELEQSEHIASFVSGELPEGSDDPARGSSA